MVIRFTAGDGPVVTSETRAWHHPRVTELRPRKGRRRSVTQFAGRRRRDVCGRLAQGRRAVMTGGAPRHDPRVIKRGAQERRRRLMARIAGRVRRNMRRGLACCLGAVVARGAGSRCHA